MGRASRHRLFAALYPLQRIWEPLGLGFHRRRVAGGARGEILEVGVGTGFSTPHYTTAPLAAVDPNAAMLRRARARARSAGHKTHFVAAAGEALPFRTGSFDTVTSVSVMCSVDDPGRVAAEVRRVLRPEGEFRFVEHGIATDRPRVATLQRGVAPVWATVMGGCRIDRDPVPEIVASFTPTRLRRCSGGSVARGTFHPSEPGPEARA